jgi:EpsI family protein
MKISMTTRVLIFCICLLAGAITLAHDSGPATVPPRDSLSNLPMVIGSWRGREMGELSENERDMLRVDDYANRAYTKPDGTSIGLYIGFHRAGGFHSPLNCLPGAGWIPVKKSYLDLPVKASAGGAAETSIHINQIVILKGLDKQVVLYWYQGCGRVIASEYWGLIYGMIDKMRLGRTDAALVRIIAPAESLDPAAEQAAARDAADFARAIYPLLSRYIPN